MESKRKKRQAPKVVSVVPPLDNRKLSPEELVFKNASLVEQLFLSTPWREIAFPLLSESIASVSGRFTNGRYWHGELTTKWSGEQGIFLAGYQKALMDFQNHLHDFILARNDLQKKRIEEEANKKSEVYNPFLEGGSGEQEIYE